jgi:hypothetical protein
MMKCMGVVLNGVLGCSLVGSLIFLCFVLAQRAGQWQEVTAELILVIVLAAEGLYAIYHLAESRSERQAASLRDFMHDFASREVLLEREKLYTRLPWRHDFGHICDEQIQWIQGVEGSIVVYKMKDNPTCKIEVTMESEIWGYIQRLSDQYHFAGLSCRRGYMALEDFFSWTGPQSLRWWRRLGHIIQQERTRRGNPALFEGFEYLAMRAQSSFREAAH